MDASRSPSNIPSPLYALAKLGRSNVQRAKLTSTKFGYKISPDPKGANVVDTNAVKEIIMQLPDLLEKGKITKKFYEDVRAGVNKLTFPHPQEKEAVQFVAQQIFDRNEDTFDAIEKKAKDSEAAFKVLKTLQGIRETSSAEGIKKIMAVHLVEENPFQQKAIELLGQLVSRERQSTILNQLQNLWIIQTPQDLQAFKHYIDLLIQIRDEGAELIRQGHYVLDVGTMLQPLEEKLQDLLMQTVFSKEISDDDQRYFMTHLGALQEQACMKNMQIMQDFFEGSFNEDLKTSKRALMRQESLKASLEDQNRREANKERPKPGDFTPVEKALVQQGFERRGIGTDFWQKVEWEDKTEIPLDEHKAIFIQGTMVFTCAVALPDGQKQSGKISFDLRNFGELNYEQVEAVMRFIEHSLFDTKPPAFPPSLEFLSKRDAQGNEMNPAFGLFVASAKEELQKMVIQKRAELEQMMAKTFFKTTHPEIPV